MCESGTKTETLLATWAGGRSGEVGSGVVSGCCPVSYSGIGDKPVLPAGLCAGGTGAVEPSLTSFMTADAVAGTARMSSTRLDAALKSNWT